MEALAAVFAGLFVHLLITTFADGRSAGRRPVRRPRPGRMAEWLAQSGLGVTPAQFVTGSAAVGAAAFWVVVSLTGVPGVAIVPAVTLALLPRAWFGHRRAARLRTVQEAWPDGVRHLIAGIQSGFTVHQAIVDLAASGPEPLREAFGRFELNARLMGTHAALEVVREQLADATSDRVIEVLAIAHDRGGQIVVQILRELAASTTKDVQAAEEAQTDRLEQTINAVAVFAIPWFVLVLLTISSDGFRRFYAAPRGWLVIGLGALMSATGALLLQRLTRDPAEDRVLSGPAGPRGHP